MLNSKILITGASGLLGYNLYLSLYQAGFTSLTGQCFQSKQTLPMVKLDLTDFKKTAKFLNSLKPEYIINCAAMTNVDQCEQNPSTAYAANSEICANLVNSLNFTCHIIHISTDQLWDGSCAFVTENVEPCPINVYGNSKWHGERHLRDHLVLRTNFFGCDLPWRSSFTGWLESRLSKNETLNGFEDVFFTPIALPLLTDIIIKVMRRNLKGIYHVGGKERISKYEFAIRFAKLKGFNPALIKKSSCKSQHFLAARPMEMSMNSSKIASELKINLSSLEESFHSTAPKSHSTLF